MTDLSGLLTAGFFAALVISALGGVVSGAVGFGFALVVVPPLLLVYDPATVVTISILLSIVTGWVVLPGATQHIRWKSVLWLIPWAILGIIAGAQLHSVLTPANVSLVASIAVILFALAVMRGWKPRGVDSPIADTIAGAVSGVMNSLTGMAGPPVALLFEARDYGVNAFRTSIVAYFMVIDIAAIGVLMVQGVIGRPQLQAAALLVPTAMIGSYVGRRVSQVIPVLLFRRIVLILLIITGIIGIGRALSGIVG